MTLDRQRARELAQALLRARNMRDRNDFLMNAPQSSMTLRGKINREAPFLDPEFPSALRGTTAGGQAASQSQELVSTPRSLPFHDPASFSYDDEIADLARARDIPVHDQLPFRPLPRNLSQLANPRKTHGRQLAANGGMGLLPTYWDYLWGRSSPSYCPPSGEDLTFPPLIYQDKAPLTEAEKDACHKQYDHDVEQCKNNYSYSRDAFQRCESRAMTIRDLCLRDREETKPWSDEDEDGIKLPRPPKGRKRR
jgi:hypothetical protein